MSNCDSNTGCCGTCCDICYPVGYCNGGACCSSCCPCPPPAAGTCGPIPCNQAVYSGETCLNQTYYFYGPSPYGPPPYGNIYFTFSFQDVIFVPMAGYPSMNSTIETFMGLFFANCDINSITAITFGTNPPPSGYVFAASGVANYCFMWQNTVYSYENPFSPYGLSGCTSTVPTVLPCSS